MDEHLQAIREELTAAKAHLAVLQETLKALEAAGMYPAVPTEQWQRRNGSPPKYLYMLFGLDRRTGRHEGPNGRRKLYVGCKPERIAEARRLAENRRRWERVNRAARRLSDWIFLKESQLQTMVTQAGLWPRIDAGALGPVDADTVATGGPNE